MLGFDDNQRWRFITSTPIIDVTFDGIELKIRSNIDGELFFADHIIGEESEWHMNGKLSKVFELSFRYEQGS